MQQFLGIMLLLLRVLLSGVLVVVPTLSYATPIVAAGGSGPRPSVGSTASGRPVVNIVAPSAAGTSHNKFDSYNVESNGVILNNGVGNSHSVRDGVIARNPNLAGAPASVILNEVTGVSPSRLSGETEVVGTSAAVVVANPNGVACDGCSFRNTPRVTLSTGEPDTANGKLSLEVSRGKVSVEGRGLQQSGVGQVDLVGRRVVLDGKVSLDSTSALSVIAGTNGYDYATGAVTAKEGTVPASYAVDASELGAMEAGRISVMSTAQGAGVRLDGNMAATAGDLVIDAAGNVRIGASREAVYAPKSITAKGNLSVRADGALEKNSNSYSYRDTEINAGSMVNTGRMDADNDLAVTVSGEYRNSGKLDAARDITLDLGGRTSNSGIIDAGRDLAIKTGGALENNDIKITAGRTITVEGTGDLLNRDTDMYAKEGITVSVPNMQHRGVSYLGSDGTVTVKAGNAIENLDHDSVIQATGALSLVAGSLIDNRYGQILGGSDVRLRAPWIDNRGGLIASTGDKGDLSIQAGALFDNYGGTLSGVNGILLDTGLFDNREGTVTAGGALVATMAGLDNRSGILLADGTVSITGTGLLDNREGYIASLSDGVSLVGQDINAEDSYLSGKTGLSLQALTGGMLTVAGAYLETEGDVSLESGGNMSLAYASLLGNRLSLSAAGDMDAPYSLLAGIDRVALGAGGKITLAGNGLLGRIVSNGTTTVTAGSLDSRGAWLQTGGMLSVSATGDITGLASEFNGSGVTVAAGGGLENTDALFLAETDVTLQSGGDMTIDGSRLLANGTVALDSGGALSADNVESGFVEDALGNIQVVTEFLKVTAASVSATWARLMGSNDVSLAALSGDMAAADATLYSGAGMLLSSGGKADLSRASVAAPEALSLTSGGDVTVDDAAIASNSDINITAGGTFINTGNNGTLLTGGDTAQVQVSAAAFRSTAGAMLANHGITLTSDGDMLLGSTLYSNTDLSLTTATGDIINQGGDVTVLGNLTVSTGGDVINSGTINVQEGFALAIAGMFDNSGGTVSTVNDITVSAGSFANDNGKLLSGGLVSLASAGTASNIGGLVFATTTLGINNGGAFDNTGGSLQSLGAMDIRADGGFSSRGGTVATNGSLTVAASGGSIDNRQGGSMASAGDMALSAANTYNGGELGTGGSIVSGGDLRITTTLGAGSDNNLSNGHGGYAEAAGSVYLTSAGRIGNEGGTYVAGQDIIINAGNAVKNYDGGVMYAGRDLSVTTTGGIMNNGGELYAAGDMALSAVSQSFLYDDGSGGGGITYHALENSQNGSITSGGDMRLDVRDVNNNSGSIIAGGDLTATVSNNGSQTSWSTYNNDGGVIHSNGDLSLTTTGALYSIGGEISAVDTVTLYADNDIDTFDGGEISGGGAVDIRNYAGSLLNYNGGAIQSGQSVSIDLGEHVENPDYAAWQVAVAAYNACLADPACIATDPGAAPPEYIRGDVFNGGGTIKAPAVSILARAVINDPIFGQGAGGLQLSTSQLRALLGAESASGTVTQVLTRNIDGVSQQQGGNVTADGPSMAEIAAYLRSLPGADSLSDEQIAYLMANYGYLARQVLDTSARMKLYGGSGAGDLARMLAGLPAGISAGGISPAVMRDPQALADALAAQQLLQQAIGFFINENQQASSAGGTFKREVLMSPSLAGLAPAAGGDIVAPPAMQLSFLLPANLQGGQIIADDLELFADEGIYNTGGTITANHSGLLSAKNITNTGGSITGGNLWLKAMENLTNTGGLIKASGLLSINAGSVFNEALTDAAGNILAKGKLRGNDIQISLQDTLTTTNGSVINADNALFIQALGGITHNAGAILKSGGDMLLSTPGMFLNLGGEVDAGRNLTVAAGDIRSMAHVTHTENGGNIHEALGPRGLLKAGGNLALLSDADITLAGTEVQSGGDMLLSAGRNLLLDTAVVHNRTETPIKKGVHVEESFTDVRTELASGGDMTLVSGGDAVLVGTQAKAAGDVGLSAGGSLLLTAAQDSAVVDVTTKKRRGLGGKSVYHYNETTVTNHAAEITAGGDVSLTAGADALLYGAKVEAGGGASVEAAGQVLAGVAEDVHEIHEVKKKSSGLGSLFDGFGLFGGGSAKESLDKVDITSQVASLAAGGAVATVSGGDTTLIAPQVTAGKGVSVTAGGAVNLLSAKDTAYESHEKSSKSLMWQSQEGHGYKSETVKLAEINAPKLEIDAAAINVDVKNLGTVQDSIAELSKQPGLEYLGRLENDPNVRWNEVNDAYETWDYKTQGLTPEGAAIIGIAVALATGDIGAGLAGLSPGAAGSAADAAFSALASQASVALVNNKGNIGKTLDDLATSDTVKNLVVAAASAGATQGLTTQLGATGNIATSAINASTSATVQSIVNGENFGDALMTQIRFAGANILGAEIASAIGDNFSSAGLGNNVAQGVGHALGGCLEGAVANGSCGGGAVGAVVGEFGAELAGNYGGVTLLQAADIGKLAAAYGGALIGDGVEGVTAAYQAGSTAIENNLLPHGECMLEGGKCSPVDEMVVGPRGGGITRPSEITAKNPNAASAINSKLSALKGAQQRAVRTTELPDGRVRYYEVEKSAKTPGPTRGASFVTEYNPQTGQVRQWMESYDHFGNVVRVHPKSINGQVINSPHYPPTGTELIR